MAYTSKVFCSPMSLLRMQAVPQTEASALIVMLQRNDARPLLQIVRENRLVVL